MRIQLDCRKTKTGATEPRSFVLGTQRLWVAHVLECDENALRRRFIVRIIDGRCFTLEEHRESGEWRLAACAGS